MTQPLPTEAYQLAEAYQLGMPTARYKVEYTRSDKIYSLVLFAYALIMLIMIGFMIASFSQTITSPPGHRTFFFPWYLLFLLFFNSINMMYTSSRKKKKQPSISFFMRNLRVYVCQDGLIYIKGRKPDIIRWNQIKRLWYTPPNTKYPSPTPSVLPSLTVYRNDGKLFQFSNFFSNIEELIATIQHEYANHRLQHIPR